MHQLYAPRAVRFVPIFLVILLATIILPHSAYAYTPREIIANQQGGGGGNYKTCGPGGDAQYLIGNPPDAPGGYTSYIFADLQEGGAPVDLLSHPGQWCQWAEEAHTASGHDSIGEAAWVHYPPGVTPTVVNYVAGGNQGSQMYAAAITYSVQACTGTNSCGQGSASGYILNNNYDGNQGPGTPGACDAVTPPDPTGYGNSCTSTANACGQTSTGTIQCNGSCSATPPANPPNYGNSCTSSANACGQTNTGTITCDGSCSATTPSDSSCPTIDLTASPAANATTTLGSSVSVSGKVSNIGTKTTGSGFNNVFLTNLNSAQTDWNTKQVVAISSALGGGASQTISTTFAGSTFTAVGKYAWEYCANMDANWASTISESNSNNNCSARGTITVVAPDLTAGNVSPGAAGTGVATTLSGQVSNIGTGSSRSAFTDLFEINKDSIPTSFSQIQVLRPYNSGVLVNGASNTATASYTFPSAGTWYVRLCADMKASGNGTITESNENNNCSSSWTAITVTSPITGTCTVSPSSGKIGDSFTWSVANVSGGTGPYTYAWSGDDGLSGTGTSVVKIYSTAGAKNGSVTVTSSGQSQTFSCTTSTGTGTGGCTDGSCINVYPPPTVSCSVNPTTVDAGQSATISWSSTNATSCKFADESSNRGTSGIRSVVPSQSPTTTYGITCTGSGGASAPCLTNITVITPGCSISANPDRVATGQTTQLTWDAQNVNSCTIKNSAGTVLSRSCSGGPLTTPAITGQEIYSITCTAAAGPAIVDSVIVNVLPLFKQF